MDRVIADRARVTGVSFAAMREEYLKKASLRRMVDASDVAHLALFLASDLARNISGQVISVDGNVEYT
jgi:enoyl-[acyl-carrier-protein] reductase (NADH)